MEVLNNIALPQSTEHFHLLLFIYNIVHGGAAAVCRAPDRLDPACRSGRTGKATPREQDGHASACTTARDRRSFRHVRSSRSLRCCLPLRSSSSMRRCFRGRPRSQRVARWPAVLLLIAAGVAGFAYQYTFRLAEAFDARTTRQ